jgi:hypothetical protein
LTETQGADASRRRFTGIALGKSAEDPRMIADVRNWRFDCSGSDRSILDPSHR